MSPWYFSRRTGMIIHSQTTICCCMMWKLTKSQTFEARVFSYPIVKFPSTRFSRRIISYLQIRKLGLSKGLPRWLISSWLLPAHSVEHLLFFLMLYHFHLVTLSPVRQREVSVKSTSVKAHATTHPPPSTQTSPDPLPGAWPAYIRKFDGKEDAI